MEHLIPVSENLLMDLHWMARRYAVGRGHIASLFNEHTRTLLSLGVPLRKSPETIWARDAQGRSFDGLTDKEAAE